MRPEIVYKYAEKVDDDFLCSICKDVLDEPLTTPCRHTFCKTCIHEWVKVSFTCPLDKQQLVFNELTPIPIAFKNLLDRLNVLCKFEAEGCDHKCPRSDLERHIKRCPFNPAAEFECDKGCQLKLNSSQLGSHQCIPALKQIISDLKGEQVRLQTELDNHQTLVSMLKKNFSSAQEKMETMKVKHSTEVAKLMTDHSFIINKMKSEADVMKNRIEVLETENENFVQERNRKRKKTISSRVGTRIRNLYPNKSKEGKDDGLKWGILLRFAGRRSVRHTIEETATNRTSPTRNT